MPLARLLLALALVAGVAAPAGARTILFVGNSFTFGEHSPVKRYHPERVDDLNGEGLGGVPALFATFAQETGEDWRVALETSPGKPLGWHLANRRAAIDRPWDVVVLQGYSTLDPDRPGDPAVHIAAAGALAALFHAANPAVQVDLTSTWTRADQVYLPTGHWYRQPVARMAQDIAAANAQALARFPDLHAALPVGAAWNRAFATGLADDDPYDGIAFGRIDLWSWDQYHASAAGYYLEALVIFAHVTGTDPRRLGERERAAEDMGLAPATAAALQAIAAATR